MIIPSGKMLQRRGERLEAGSIQECQGRYGREVVWRDDMTWGLCVVTDIKTRAWYIHLHIYPLTTQTTEQEVDNENILANTQFMLSAP